jgi:hypothetical protein
MKEQQRINGNRFPAEIRNQVLKEYNTPALWHGKQAQEREAILNEKYKLGTGTLTYWVRKQTGWQQPQSKKKKPHIKVKKKKPTTAMVVQPTPIATHSGHRETELLLRAVQRKLDRDHKLASELTTIELTTLLALRNLEGKG